MTSDHISHDQSATSLKDKKILSSKMVSWKSRKLPNRQETFRNMGETISSEMASAILE
jgi:hypothetical protein